MYKGEGGPLISKVSSNIVEGTAHRESTINRETIEQEERYREPDAMSWAPWPLRVDFTFRIMRLLWSH
jgi:hypothetical protein